MREFVTILASVMPIIKTTGNIIVIHPFYLIFCMAAKFKETEFFMRKDHQKMIRSLTSSALIAASYVVLAIICDAFGLLKYAVQIRLPEALCVLVAFTPAAIPGVAIGCLITNLLLAGAPLDIIFGTVATLIGAYIGHAIIKSKPKTMINLILATIPTLISNTVIMPPVIVYSYGTEMALPWVYLTVFLGELISACIIGVILGNALKKSKLHFD